MVFSMTPRRSATTKLQRLKRGIAPSSGLINTPEARPRSPWQKWNFGTETKFQMVKRNGLRGTEFRLRPEFSLRHCAAVARHYKADGHRPPLQCVTCVRAHSDFTKTRCQKF